MFDINLFKALYDTESHLLKLFYAYDSAIADELACGDSDEVKRLCDCRGEVWKMHQTIFKERLKMEETFK